MRWCVGIGFRGGRWLLRIFGRSLFLVIPGEVNRMSRAMLHDPAVYADPGRFWPERYLSAESAPDPGLYAFGFGRR